MATTGSDLPTPPTLARRRRRKSVLALMAHSVGMALAEGLGLVEDAAKKPGMQLQTVAVLKTHAKTLAQAKRMAQKHGADTSKVDETEGAFRFRQKDPGGFLPNSYRTTKPEPGVALVWARPRGK